MSEGKSQPPLPGILDEITVNDITSKLSCLSSTDGKSHLLPGIPDDITLKEITSKLLWRDFYILSSVSPAWCRAIRSRQVYKARVHSHSTETLVLVNYERSRGLTAIALYSMGDNFCLELPRIPAGIPTGSQSVSLDGKIYVLGGVHPLGSRQVYVLDLAGQIQWKRCANMNQARAEFGCGVMDGKIYVFGGVTASLAGNSLRFSPVCGAEVYDPKENVWSEIRSMISLRFRHRVETVGEELFAHGGMFFGRDYFDSTEKHRIMDIEDEEHTEVADFLEIYNPTKDEWRVIDPSWRGSEAIYFVAQGKLHAMSETNNAPIYVHNVDEDSWKQLHSSSFISIGPVGSIFVMPFAVLAVDDELFAAICWCNKNDTSLHNSDRFCLLRSKGLGSKTKRIKWQIHKRSLEYLRPDRPAFFMYTIAL